MMAMIKVVVEDASILGKMPVPTALNRRDQFSSSTELMSSCLLLVCLDPIQGGGSPKEGREMIHLLLLLVDCRYIRILWAAAGADQQVSTFTTLDFSTLHVF